jgi:hypothetical protein
MDTYIRSILEDAGWYEGREREIDYMIEEIKNTRLTVTNKLVEDFLKEFVNLELNFKIPNGQYGNARLILDDILPYLNPKHFKVYTLLAKEDIVPIGTLFENTADLFISYTGKFYMAAETEFYLLGNDFDTFLHNTIYQKDILRIRY